MILKSEEGQPTTFVRLVTVYRFGSTVMSQQNDWGLYVRDEVASPRVYFAHVSGPPAIMISGVADDD